MSNVQKFKVIGNSDKYDGHHFPVGTVVWSFPEHGDVGVKSAYTDGSDYWWLPKEDLELIQE